MNVSVACRSPTKSTMVTVIITTVTSNATAVGTRDSRVTSKLREVMASSELIPTPPNR